MFNRDVNKYLIDKIDDQQLDNVSHEKHPGDSIRPVNPIVSDRIRVGLCRNPTSSIKNRSDPMGLLSDSIQSESDTDFVGIRRNPIKI